MTRPSTLAKDRAAPRHRWEFHVPATLSRGCAWLRCVKAGLRVGIPQHAWRRAHVYNEGAPTWWVWYTACPARIDYQAAVHGLRSCVPEGELPAYLRPREVDGV